MPQAGAPSGAVPSARNLAVLLSLSGRTCLLEGSCRCRTSRLLRMPPRRVCFRCACAGAAMTSISSLPIFLMTPLSARHLWIPPSSGLTQLRPVLAALAFGRATGTFVRTTPLTGERRPASSAPLAVLLRMASISLRAAQAWSTSTGSGIPRAGSGRTSSPCKMAACGPLDLTASISPQP